MNEMSCHLWAEGDLKAKRLCKVLDNLGQPGSSQHELSSVEPPIQIILFGYLQLSRDMWQNAVILEELGKGGRLIQRVGGYINPLGSHVH